jgi:hypothetical protein
MKHEFLPPCKHFYKCEEKNPEHFEIYSHPCEWGVNCKQKNQDNLDERRHLMVSLLDK